MRMRCFFEISTITSYYRGAVGAMLVYDITDRDSFSRLQYWYDEMKNSSDPSIVAMLVWI